MRRSNNFDETRYSRTNLRFRRTIKQSEVSSTSQSPETMITRIRKTHTNSDEVTLKTEHYFCENKETKSGKPKNFPSCNDNACVLVELLSLDKVSGLKKCEACKISKCLEDREEPKESRGNYENCTDCVVEQKATEILNFGNDRVCDDDFEFEEQSLNDLCCDDRFRKDELATTSSTFVSTTKFEAPTLIDFATDEKDAWKENFLKLQDVEKFEEGSNGFCETDEIKKAEDFKASQIMTIDSSSRLSRRTGSLTTALRDRGSYVIPAQPNRSLPIHPAPLIPTRSISISKSQGLSSPTLKFSKVSEAVENFDVDLGNSKKNSLANEKKEYDLEELTKMEEELILSNSFEPNDFCSKRKIVEEKDEEGKETRESKRRRKSRENDQGIEERIDKLLEKEFVMNNLNKQGKRDLSSEERCQVFVDVLTRNNLVGKEAEVANKVVPPLRLKKVVREGSNDGTQNNGAFLDSEKELNYRIVTGATPRPFSPLNPTDTSWCSVISTKDDVASTSLSDNNNSLSVNNNNSVSTNSDNNSSVNSSGSNCWSAPKSDKYKLKFRRNKLKQKLRELQGKALNLAEEMANAPKTEDLSPQHSTRMRQMMNCYEKQIENVSKLLDKLSARSEDVVDVEEEDSIENDYSFFELDDVIDYELENGEEISRISTPEPPKLSPRLPMNYQEEKNFLEGRDSPPILSKVCLTITNDLDSVENKETFDKSINIWEEGMNVSEDSTKLKSTLNIVDEESNSSENYESANTEFNVGNEDRIESPTSPVKLIKTNLRDSEIDKTHLIGIKDIVDLDRSLRTPQANENNMTGLEIMEKDSKEQSKLNENFSADQILLEEPIKKGELTNCDGRTHFGSVDDAASSINTGPEVSTNISERGEIPATMVTSSSNQSDINCPTTQLSYSQVPFSAISNNEQRATSSKKDNEDIIVDGSPQRLDGTRIMTEQFPTLGNWVAKMSRKNATKSKSKTQINPQGISSLNEDVVHVFGVETPKTVNGINSGIRSNIVNVSPQWNTERWQRQQHQQRQQQFLQQVAAANVPPQSFPPPPPPPSRPGLCPPMSLPQFYPNNYMDLYGNSFGYPSICPYTSYPYHSRLHSGPPLTGYQIPMQDLSNTLRSMQHVDKRLSLQDQARHFATDILKYPGPLGPSSFQHPNAIDFERLRATSTAHNAPASGCLPHILLPPGPPLSNSAQQTLSRTSPTGYSGNGQFGRRMIPDVVAAAAAAAVVAAASFGRQRDPLPGFPRTEQEASTSNSVPGIVTSANPCLPTNRTSNVNPANSTQNNVPTSNEDLRLSSAGYSQLQNLILDGLPYVRNENQVSNYNQFENSQAGNTSASSTSVYKLSSHSSTRSHLANDQRNCETPHLGVVNKSPDTMSNLKCANCGLPGSAFKCLGCEAAYYCDERCQARHWNVHVEKCPKKMPKLKKVV